MISNYNDPLPGVPRVESPFFDRFFAPGVTDDETLRIAQDLRDDGYAVIDFPEADFDAIAERIKANLTDRYDWAGWKGHGASLRVQDTWKIDGDVRSIATNAAAMDLLGRLYGREPFPFQSLNFPVGTQQHYHSDALHFSSMPERFMCGIWVALEDIGMDQGPLVYYPGSHKWPIYQNEHVGHTFGAVGRTGQEVYEPLWNEMIETTGIKPHYFEAKKGQALIWAANLLHGGSPHRDRNKTRWSQVTHYYFKDCAYYTPMHSDPVIGLVSYRQPFNIKTGGTERNVYNGLTIPDRVVTAANPAAGDHGWVIGLPDGFDAAGYLAANADVAAAGLDPVDHFRQHGRAEGRSWGR